MQAGDVDLTPADTAKVLEELLEAQNETYTLGLSLGLSPTVVEAIHATNFIPRDRLLKIIMEFLKRMEPKPTWRLIVEALKSPVVNLPRIAHKVEAAHFPDVEPTLSCSDFDTGKYACIHMNYLNPILMFSCI